MFLNKKTLMNKNLKKVYNKAIKSIPDDAESFDECAVIFAENFSVLFLKEVLKVITKCEADEWFDVSGAVKEHFED